MILRKVWKGKDRQDDFQPLSFRRVTICPEPGCLKEENQCSLHAILRAEEVELISEVERSPYHKGLAEHGEIR